MTVTVFVWMPKASLQQKNRSVGHASLHLTTKKSYISFWPEAGSKGRAVGHNMGADRHFESDKLPDYASAPITCLNEDAIAAYWKTVKVGTRTVPYQGGKGTMHSRADAASYEIFENNCSTIVMNCLIAGGALNHPRVKTLYSETSTMTPLDIRQIAEILAGECGSVGGAKFPIGDSLIDKTLNAGSNAAYYGSYVASALLGAAAGAVRQIGK